MEESYSSICSHHAQTVNQQLFEAIGGLRFALRYAADFISIRMTLSDSALTVPAAELDQFLKLTESVCTDHVINVKDHGPRVFLFKLLFRQYGAALVHTCTTKQSSFNWLVPEGVLTSYKVEVIPIDRQYSYHFHIIIIGI